MCLLRQVDNFALACTKEAPADETCDITGKKLQLLKEDKAPFLKMGLTSDFNGMDVSQTDACIKLLCAACIDRPVTSHSWKEDKQIKDVSKTIAPPNTKAVKQVCKQKGPLKGTAEHKDLEAKSGFGPCQTFLGDMMCAHVTCRPNVGCAITPLSKFSSSPSAHHHACPKNAAQCL